MRRPLLIASVGFGVLSAILVVVSALMFFERPTTLRVAVSSTDAEDYDLMGALAKQLKHARKSLRLRLVNTDGAAAAAAAVDAGTADLAVVRTDVGMPDKGGTVMLLHKDVGLLVAPGGSEVAKIADLAGRTVGMVSQGAGDGRLLETALGQYDLAPEAVKTVPLKLEEIGRALRSHAVDAIFVVGQVSSGLVPAAIKVVGAAGEGPPVFLPVAEADAVAQRLPAYESIEVVRGAFGGTPPRPAEEFDTLGVTYRLVANEDLDQGAIAALTRFLLSERLSLAQAAPIARRMEAPSTEKGAALPVHPGTAAYIDDEEETFLDRYSDFFYIGAMVLGVVASGATAVFTRLSASSGVAVEELVGRLLVIFKAVRATTVPAALDSYEDEVDTIVASALDAGGLRSLDERRVAMLNIAVDQVRAAIRDRRETLRRELLVPLEAPPLTIEQVPPSLTIASHGTAGTG